MACRGRRMASLALTAITRVIARTPQADAAISCRHGAGGAASLTLVLAYGSNPYQLSAPMETAMSATGAAREDRIELRATKEEKRLLATAAAYERLDVTSFIMRSALPAAREVVDRAERILPSQPHSARVLELLENPPKPTPALMSAARRRATRK